MAFPFFSPRHLTLSLPGLVLILSLGASAGAQEPPPAAAEEKPKAAPPGAAPAGKIIVPEGTRLPLVLHNAVSTRNAKPGDPVYFETLFPVIVDERIVFPAGSYVSGEIVQAKRPGRVKGRGELLLRINKMILPNGYTVDFRAFPTGAGTGGNEEVEEEGKIKGDTDKGSDAAVVVATAGIGTGIGTIGGSGRSVGIGAGIGAAAGLAAVMLSRGPEAELPRGSTLDIMIDRAITLDSSKINFTDPGRASVVPGPDDRRPQRRRFPY